VLCTGIYAGHLIVTICRCSGKYLVGTVRQLRPSTAPIAGGIANDVQAQSMLPDKLAADPNAVPASGRKQQECFHRPNAGSQCVVGLM